MARRPSRPRPDHAEPMVPLATAPFQTFSPISERFRASFRSTGKPHNSLVRGANSLKKWARSLCCPLGTRGPARAPIKHKPLILLMYTGIIGHRHRGSPARPMGPKAPGGGNRPGPRSRPGQMGPEPALGRAIPARAGGGGRGGRGGARGGWVWSRARPMGPKAPGGGKPPGPRSRDRARWDPEPALGLAIRPSGAWARASGTAIRPSGMGRERELPLACVRVVGQAGEPLGVSA